MRAESLESAQRRAGATRTLCAADFDGTITDVDTLRLIVDRVLDGDRSRAWIVRTPGGLAEEIAAALRAVRLSEEALMGVVLPAVCARDGFGDWVSRTLARRDRIVVVSAGAASAR